MPPDGGPSAGSIMEADLQAQVAFHLTGRRPAESLEAVEGLSLRPALLARYRDLSALRYDFPVVLVRGAAPDDCIRPLSALVDALLEDAAPQGVEGERMRKHLLGLERAIRTLLAQGSPGLLSALWDRAAASLPPESAESLKRARAALKADGEVLDCDAAMPARVLAHAWNAVQADKTRRLRARIDRIALRLAEILKADFAGSDAGRSARHLRASVGTAHQDAFDFDAMSRLLARSKVRAELPEARRARLRRLLSALEAQRFVAAEDSERNEASRPYAFVFDGCAAAAKAFRERAPRLGELVRAIDAAELEIEGLYREDVHDPVFEASAGGGLDAETLAQFPDYLVRISSADRAETARLMEILSAGLPVKALMQTDDLLEASTLGDGRLAFGLRSKEVADMAIGLASVFVLQSGASSLVRCRASVLEGLRYPGPALFSVFSGAGGSNGGLPPYLVSAAAAESRLFPAFAYNPGAGSDWASRFSLEGNPQPDRDWPSQAFSYEDPDHQRITEEIDFTPADFAACDERAARHFARVPRANWNGGMIPVRECLERPAVGLPDKVPCLLMVDPCDALHKVIVDERLIAEARRASAMWRSLRELGGVRNSHVERALRLERQAWEEKLKENEGRRPEAKPAASTAPAPAAPAAAPAAAAPAEAEKQAASDDPYIETPRCTSCDECTRLNNRMFAYDGNKQAYVKDPGAGSYRELVEAAESCQVSIIHPGKPRNPDEPGLAELLERARPFL